MRYYLVSLTWLWIGLFLGEWLRVDQDSALNALITKALQWLTAATIAYIFVRGLVYLVG